jgi:hypothetical protein
VAAAGKQVTAPGLHAHAPSVAVHHAHPAQGPRGSAHVIG